MKIVIIDSYACDFDGISWKSFSSLGEVTVFPRTSKEEKLKRSTDAEAVIVNKVVYDAETIGKLPKLRYIGVTATGVNNVDLDAARRAGITVTNVPGYSTSAVSQYVFACILDHFSKLRDYNDLVRTGAWTKSPDFCLHSTPIAGLGGRIVGIVGLGNIGREVAHIAESFGMQAVAAALPGRDYSTDDHIARLSLEETVRRSDVVTLHCSLSSTTEKIINAATLKWFKESAILINSARGGLVDEQALADALNDGRLAAAYLDVLSVEPPPADHPLLSARRTKFTPHIAWATREARDRLVNESFENLRAFLSGQKRNCVN